MPLRVGLDGLAAGEDPRRGRVARFAAAGRRTSGGLTPARTSSERIGDAVEPGAPAAVYVSESSMVTVPVAPAGARTASSPVPWTPPSRRDHGWRLPSNAGRTARADLRRKVVVGRTNTGSSAPDRPRTGRAPPHLDRQWLERVAEARAVKRRNVGDVRIGRCGEPPEAAEAAWRPVRRSPSGGRRERAGTLPSRSPTCPAVDPVVGLGWSGRRNIGTWLLVGSNTNRSEQALTFTGVPPVTGTPLAARETRASPSSAHSLARPRCNWTAPTSG